mmetsp:Transcript_115180/g.229425  ORF Transcript_115180/g.229425 Transcript_115180/m.229425 type:complete len:327 (-) Transcript_115180:280-1260(-)
MKVPSNGDANHLLAGGILDTLFHIILHTLRATDLGKPFDKDSKVFHSLVLEVSILEDAQLSDTVDQAASKRADVDPVAKSHLGPHESLLRLIAPGHKDTILSWGSKVTCPEDEQSTIDRITHARPANRNQKRPPNDDTLEIEVQRHAWARYQGAAQIRGERPQPSMTFAMLLWLMELLALTKLHAFRKTAGVRNWPQANVNSPSHPEQDNDTKDNGNHCEKDHVFRIALAVLLPQVVPVLTRVALVLVDAMLILLAIAYHWSTADAHGRISDCRFRVKLCAVLSPNALEAADLIVQLVLHVKRACSGAWLILVIRRRHHEGLVAKV